jgi:hypothetical protein
MGAGASASTAVDGGEGINDQGFFEAFQTVSREYREAKDTPDSNEEARHLIARFKMLREAKDTTDSDEEQPERCPSTQREVRHRSFDTARAADALGRARVGLKIKRARFAGGGALIFGSLCGGAYGGDYRKAVLDGAGRSLITDQGGAAGGLASQCVLSVTEQQFSTALSKSYAFLGWSVEDFAAVFGQLTGGGAMLTVDCIHALLAALSGPAEYTSWSPFGEQVWSADLAKQRAEYALSEARGASAAPIHGSVTPSELDPEWFTAWRRGRKYGNGAVAAGAPAIAAVATEVESAKAVATAGEIFSEAEPICGAYT